MALWDGELDPLFPVIPDYLFLPHPWIANISQKIGYNGEWQTGTPTHSALHHVSAQALLVSMAQC